MSKPNRLIVLPPSHFCERARWALDHAGVEYLEERLAVGLHLSRAKKIAPKSSLPIFVTGNEVIQGSGAIVDWTGMAGADPAIEQRMESGIAILSRALIYSAALHDPRAGIRSILFDGVTGSQAVLGRAMWPMTRRLMAKGMKVSPDRLPELEARIEAELDWLEARIAGRRYLVGDSFGRADLTVASLIRPILRDTAPPSRKVVALPPAVEATIMRWNERPALRFAQRIYADHRHAVSAAVHAATTPSSERRRHAPLE